MNTIYKYALDIIDEQILEIPGTAQILTVQYQGHHPCLWALVDPNALTAPRIIRIIGTGHPIPDAASLSYIATFQWDRLVFHVFEKLPGAESTAE